ncbi:DNA alkylation repair protein [Heyndrickxia acidicola]|uniref:DNA alkylation repair protein n=1 Tax=Heyndrickxia acidicola TaxID=209389 RepID=A0ABU6MD77_9BACI|nr:DNA alkylation repair protein [Heyndrickxia acidicola]MED1202389.1 DNA alkylation repair protein [Heyndrickxia acidicola]
MGDIEVLKSLFKERANKENAASMEKYMKNHFIFLGIKAPVRRDLMKEFYLKTGILKKDFYVDFVKEVWRLSEREYQYAALDYGSKFLRKLDPSHLALLMSFITSKSWWDTVDPLASNFIGTLASRFPELIEQIDQWAVDENMWLRRTAILFQLKYKGNTDEERLYRNILLNANSKEFFIQKAMGWTLREYSKTNPESVQMFIEKNELPRLTIREGSKYLEVD